MSTRKSPRKGSLQFWPRKRASKFLPRVNWEAVPGIKPGLNGFICYKAGMKSAYVKNNTEHSLTKGKGIAIPVTILECPTMRIFSVRLYKEGVVAKEVLSEQIDKEMKKKVKLPKTKKISLKDIKAEDYDDVRVIIYSQVKKLGLKKTPDMSEVGLTGNNVEEKLNYVKENINKELSVSEFHEKGQLIDLRGLTRGRGFQGPVRRFGITLRFHKSEKGIRKVGSIAPWHPSRVTFRTPMAGQLGMFTRIVYNNKIMGIVKASEGKEIKGLKNYGDIKGDYIIVNGSIQGTAKRQLLITPAIRPTRRQTKKNYDLVEIR
jgi:large subunit ribosomal protein L3